MAMGVVVCILASLRKNQCVLTKYDCCMLLPPLLLVLSSAFVVVVVVVVVVVPVVFVVVVVVFFVCLLTCLLVWLFVCLLLFNTLANDAIVVLWATIFFCRRVGGRMSKNENQFLFHCRNLKAIRWEVSNSWTVVVQAIWRELPHEPSVLLCNCNRYHV